MLDQTTSATSHSGTSPRPQAPQEQQPSLTDSADQAVQSVATLYQAVDSALQRQVQDNPYKTLAAAAAVGFVLGGGLRSPIGQLFVRLSVRAFGPPLVNAALHSALERATSDGQSVG